MIEAPAALPALQDHQGRLQLQSGTHLMESSTRTTDAEGYRSSHHPSSINASRLKSLNPRYSLQHSARDSMGQSLSQNEAKTTPVQQVLGMSAWNFSSGSIVSHGTAGRDCYMANSDSDVLTDSESRGRDV